jgi:hypothetical protein
MLLLLIAAAGHVVGKQPSHTRRGVEACKQRNDGQPLHGHGEVAADHRAEPVGFAVEAQQRAFNFFVVLQLDLEQPGKVYRDAGRPGDAENRVLVRGKDLLDVPAGDDVAHGGAAVTGHDDAACIRHGHNRGGVRHLQVRAGRLAVGRRPVVWKQVRTVALEMLSERRCRVGGYLVGCCLLH